MIPFDVHRVPLAGRNLIEAAAGTGKTWSIEQLFVRLIMEQGCRVEEILTVTFTQAATDELRGRIHARLLQARQEVRGESAGGGDRERRAARVERALADFDRAAIYTIHGFCQRVLREHAFETGGSFSAELIPDPSALLREVAEDYWRTVTADAPPEAVAWLLETLAGPSGLLSFLARVKAPVYRVAPEPEAVEFTALEAYRRALETLRGLWAAQGDAALRLLADPGLHAGTYGSCEPGARKTREGKLRELRAAVESLLAPGSAGGSQAEGIKDLCTDTILVRTKKGKTAPRHPLFDCCAELRAAARALEVELTRYLRHVKAKFLDVARTGLARRKSERNLLSFDDLLSRLHRTLTGPQGTALAAALRRRFRAVLVDEFQDTDELQYAIFETVFGRSDSCLFWIGDPKQAIYGFRGADIFAYLRAARSAETGYTLEDNYRSTPALVRAVNTLFASAPSPFLFPDIGFRPARAAGRTTGAPPGLVVWHVEAERQRDDGNPLTKGAAEPLVAQAVAGEILRLTTTRRTPLPAGDIAVLVRTNGQARLVKESLAGLNIPAVVCSTGSIFDAPEAEEVERILLSLSTPADAARFKSALATSILGATAEELDGSEPDSGWWAERYERHRSFAEQWQREGFIPMFRALLSREGVKQRLLGLRDGERRLTNVLHLAELLHQADADGGLGPSGLVRWLARQRAPSAPGRGEHPLRLESDARAVQIVTIHKSKGLEYRVVFCPYPWSASEADGDDLLFHDPAAQDALTIEISAEANSLAYGCLDRELLSENLRLLYVAVTRAQVRCYLAWGRVNQAETSALAYLLHGAGLGADDVGGRISARMKARMADLTDADIRADLDRLALRSEGTIEILPLPDAPADRRTHPAPASAAPLRCRTFTGSIDRTWRTGSYSTLISGSHDPDAPDREPGFASSESRPSGPPDPAGITDFPAGSRAGSFFHAVLEAVDFRRAAHSDTERIISERLRSFGFAPEWMGSVSRLVADVAEVDLFPDDGCILSRMRPEDRLAEMEFHHPLNLLSPRVLQEVFARCGRADVLRGVPERLGRLTFAPLRGHMKGFIDLVAVHRGRFYLVDWKSNHLGPDRDDYGVERLSAVMRDEFYTLQYHIYTLALHLYLRRRLPGYDYARHFGGAAYVFLRGLDRDGGREAGIFRDRPEADLVHALGRALIPDYE